MNETTDPFTVSPHVFADGLPEIATLADFIRVQGAASLALRAAADELRREIHGDAVFLRGIIEFSNYCCNRCAYCGINIDNEAVERYRMTPQEVLETARNALRWGCGTVVLQSGDDPGYGIERLADLVRKIKTGLGLAVTLSVGVLEREELAMLKEAGADRYLLRFETSDPQLFARIHPDESFERRLRCLHDLHELGYQVGSGFMIALPGATPESIAADILFATSLKLDMIGCGPFMASPGTPLADAGRAEQTDLYYNVMALLRLCNPPAHIPATTAFDTLDHDGRNRVLQGGANVFMPNLTPARFREHYQLYPNKPCVDEDGEACAFCVRGRVAALGRTIDAGPGHSKLQAVE